MRKREFSSVKIKLLRRKKILQNIWASIKVNYLLVECEIIKKMFNYSMFVLCEVGLCRKLKNPPHHITYHDAIYHVFNSILYFTFISTKIQQQQKYPTNEKFLFEVLCVIQFPITQSFTLIKQPNMLEFDYQHNHCKVKTIATSNKMRSPTSLFINSPYITHIISAMHSHFFFGWSEY